MYDIISLDANCQMIVLKIVFDIVYIFSTSFMDHHPINLLI